MQKTRRNLEKLLIKLEQAMEEVNTGIQEKDPRKYFDKKENAIILEEAIIELRKFMYQRANNWK